jgi:hypothetical protein
VFIVHTLEDERQLEWDSWKRPKLEQKRVVFFIIAMSCVGQSSNTVCVFFFQNCKNVVGLLFLTAVSVLCWFISYPLHKIELKWIEIEKKILMPLCSWAVHVGTPHLKLHSLLLFFLYYFEGKVSTAIYLIFILLWFFYLIFILLWFFYLMLFNSHLNVDLVVLAFRFCMMFVLFRFTDLFQFKFSVDLMILMSSTL